MKRSITVVLTISLSALLCSLGGWFYWFNWKPTQTDTKLLQSRVANLEKADLILSDQLSNVEIQLREATQSAAETATPSPTSGVVVKPAVDFSELIADLKANFECWESAKFDMDKCVEKSTYPGPGECDEDCREDQCEHTKDRFEESKDETISELQTAISKLEQGVFVETYDINKCSEGVAWIDVPAQKLKAVE